jgi:NAD(P)-dependent dehydrogenase (short-subunit alcohol dehydrogenase family)
MILQGKKALVTGGTRGIGAAIAERLHAMGASVTITGRGGQSTKFNFRAVDFTDVNATESFCREVATSQFDILVNNAGINKIAPFSEVLPEDFDRIHKVNVRAPFRLCQAVLPHMRSMGWGRIITVSSIFGVVSKEYRASYSTSKFAVDGMTAALAAEVAQYGILANCVAPGFIDTELTRDVLGVAGIHELKEKIPARRLGAADEIANYIAWLCGPENTYISGQNLVIDGGYVRV